MYFLYVCSWNLTANEIETIPQCKYPLIRDGNRIGRVNRKNFSPHNYGKFASTNKSSEYWFAVKLKGSKALKCLNSCLHLYTKSHFAQVGYIVAISVKDRKQSTWHPWLLPTSNVNSQISCTLIVLALLEP